MATFSFEKVREQNPVEEAVRSYVITDRSVNGFDPELIVKHAGDGNQAFTDYVMEQALKELPDDDKAADPVKSMKDNIELLVETLIVDWNDVYDDKNKKVPFSKDACEAYLNALNPMKVGQILVFCQNEANFTKKGGAKAMPLAEQEQVAKNSQGDTSKS